MSSAIAAALRPIPFRTSKLLRREPAAQAFTVLRITFTVAPILFGLDKFAEVMIGDWPKYLALEFNDLIPGNGQDAMYIIGAVEIAAGLVVAVSPRVGGLLVAGWLGGIIVSLLVGGYADIAPRDFGLLLGALTLARLATAYSGRAPTRTTSVRRCGQGAPSATPRLMLHAKPELLQSLSRRARAVERITRLLSLSSTLLDEPAPATTWWTSAANR